MTFQTKNFSYLKQSFGDFMAAVTSGAQLYLRSVATTQPAKHATHLSKDFPSLAADFCLPEVLSTVSSNAHSSPLRISGPVTLWLHYDVLANVLCQIRGTKRLRLYPPSDVSRLAYPPGASSSNVDVFASRNDMSDAQYANLMRTHPHEAFLRPGDVLFIPPAWSHTAKPEEKLSVAVNCFWRNLGDEVYAQGRDVYGNRDIAAYEEGRKAVEKMAKGFEGVPKDLRGFYLERLVGELREKVEASGAEGVGEGNERDS
ncbi:Transcription factor jumonji/aspartyl beta-hydroxylase [Macrophomina phaseolina MS6]|uniref:Transcription factor jumonji/aspartyl beta-hydroxylase n=2 Tax=Macrophomina phaseolina TaxID=35725 RepID=K2RVH7_MACPH|nr:Transcription factor jumonji/aspartyl beta-hydroxylase [Macrophomina phaseolina MS6]